MSCENKKAMIRLAVLSGGQPSGVGAITIVGNDDEDGLY
jgi:hypothetical protein